MIKNKKLILLIVCIALLAVVGGIAVLVLSSDTSDYIGKMVYEGVYYDEQRVTLQDGKKTNTFVLTISSENESLKIVTGVPGDETPLEPGATETVYEQAISAEANGKYVVAGINADYFHMGNNERIQPCSVTIKDGELLTEFYTSRWDRDCFFGIKKDGSAVLGDEAVYEDVQNELYQAVGGGPWLVTNGVAVSFDEEDRHPRTAIGILEDGSIIMMAADGRSDESAGFSYKELADYMRSLDCIEAMNLDGGGSTTLVLKETGEKGPEFDCIEVMNEPSDQSERPVGNALLVMDESIK